MDEHELILRAKEERDQIFERYDKGRQSDNIINEWEDGPYKKYQLADR